MRKLLVYLLVAYALITGVVQYWMNVAGNIPAYIIPLTTLLGFSIALLHARERMDWSRTLWLLASAFVVSLTFESVGVLTGLVYGPYHYTPKLGFLFLGLVPLIIPVAWFMMMYPSFVIADWIIPAKAAGRSALVAAIGAVIMTAWDVVMDPVMVSGGHWVWDVNGPYFGIPLQNFSGWWLTTFVTFAVFLWLGKPALPQHSDPGFDRLAIYLFVITALGSISGALLGGLGGAGLAGIFAIFPWMIFGWLRMQGK
ncbi:MAG TPA: carotenoid biosynthesis protein [Anaerolineales bacterium]|nr:carotenoid biosynthesis protein [Anaerolineales bacterium]HNN12709.1 carotenoid biosynthesis protein [Anaerolineales bacterium]HNO32265.1 carotenoid biosynthesis protein [Anaerolineales bacterium]